jgi:hypothetical protein
MTKCQAGGVCAAVNAEILSCEAPLDNVNLQLRWIFVAPSTRLDVGSQKYCPCLLVCLG